MVTHIKFLKSNPEWGRSYKSSAPQRQIPFTSTPYSSHMNRVNIANTSLADYNVAPRCENRMINGKSQNLM